MQEPRGPVRALGKALELLELLLRERRPMSLQELCAGSGYPKSTSHALLATLRSNKDLLRRILEAGEDEDRETSEDEEEEKDRP